jgi:hypothetical protein
MYRSVSIAAIVAVAAVLSLAAAQSPALQVAPAYHVTKSVPLGAPDRWDYIVFDSRNGRPYRKRSSERLDSDLSVLPRVTYSDGGSISCP